MNAAPLLHLTEADYLTLDRASQHQRFEYFDGHVVAMAGASLRHELIVANLIRALGNRFGDGPCIALGSNVRVKLAESRSYVYPDVTVVCGEPELVDGAPDLLQNPTVLIEVLSKSTEKIDLEVKAQRFRKVAALKAHVFVSQHEPHVEVTERHPDGWLLRDAAGLDATFTIKSLSIEIPLAEVYRGVAFKEEDDLP